MAKSLKNSMAMQIFSPKKFVENLTQFEEAKKTAKWREKLAFLV